MTISSHRSKRFACCCDYASRFSARWLLGVAVAAVVLLSPASARAKLLAIS